MKEAFIIKVSEVEKIAAPIHFINREYSVTDKQLIEAYNLLNEKDNIVSDLESSKYVEDLMFKGVERNVFISHSHSNVAEAKKLAEFLKSRDQSSFIDSEIWHHVDNVIMNEAVKIKTTSHAVAVAKKYNMILTVALAKMIQKCDYFIFISSPNSVVGNQTYSPWLFFELAQATVLRRNSPTAEFNKSADLHESFKYDVEFKEFKEIDYAKLNKRFPLNSR